MDLQVEVAVTPYSARTHDRADQALSLRPTEAVQTPSASPHRFKTTSCSSDPALPSLLSSKALRVKVWRDTQPDWVSQVMRCDGTLVVNLALEGIRSTVWGGAPGSAGPLPSPIHIHVLICVLSSIIALQATNQHKVPYTRSSRPWHHAGREVGRLSSWL